MFKIFGLSKRERQLIRELAIAHKTIRDAWGAISSGQLIDKQVEKTLRESINRNVDFADKIPETLYKEYNKAYRGS